MSEVTPGDLPRPPKTIDEVAEWIVGQMNNAASLPEDAAAARGLLGTWAGYMTERGVSDVPADVAQREFLIAIIELESRIAVIERTLKSAGIVVPPMSALRRPNQ
jgi:hypothetical protein